MITIDETTVGCWFIDLDPITDFMCTLRKEKGNYKAESRFRYSDKNPPDKNWFTAELTPDISENEALRFARNQIIGFEKMSGNKGHEILMHDGNVQEFYEELKQYTNILSSGKVV